MVHNNTAIKRQMPDMVKSYEKELPCFSHLQFAVLY